jgi:hypothetical protein
MKTYKIGCLWTCYGYVEVEANSLEEAIKTAEENIDYFELPTDWEYADGSFELDLDEDIIEWLNKDNEE